MSNNHLIIDVSFLAHRHFHAVAKKLSDYPKMIVEWVIAGIIKDVGNFQDLMMCGRVHFAFDADSIRSKIFSNYKKKENTREPEKRAARPLHRAIRKLRRRTLPLLGFSRIYYKEQWEADDIIGALCRTLRGNKTILSGDSDLFPLLKKEGKYSTIICNPINHQTYTYQNLRKLKGVRPEQWTRFRALVGGKDNIPGVKGIGKKTAIDLLNGDPVTKAKQKLVAQSEKQLTEICAHLTLPHFALKKRGWLKKRMNRKDRTSMERFQKWERTENEIKDTREYKRPRGNNELER